MSYLWVEDKDASELLHCGTRRPNHLARRSLKLTRAQCVADRPATSTRSHSPQPMNVQHKTTPGNPDCEATYPWSALWRCQSLPEPRKQAWVAPQEIVQHLLGQRSCSIWRQACACMWGYTSTYRLLRKWQAPTPQAATEPPERSAARQLHIALLCLRHGCGGRRGIQTPSAVARSKLCTDAAANQADSQPSAPCSNTQSRCEHKPSANA